MTSDYSPGPLIEETFALIVEQAEFLSQHSPKTGIHNVDGVYRAHLHSLFHNYTLALPNFKSSLDDVLRDWPSIVYDPQSLWFNFYF